ncbi:MAG TPA: hypothetical protein VGU23_01785, partial [Acidobacteriaceae bacterium]|nr:hypothetical protein [Acidobacteriaceae bacterium]
RILAIELRASRMGYALFEGPRRLLDWGTTAIRPEGNAKTATTHKPISELLKALSPSAVVVKKIRRWRHDKRARTQAVLRQIQLEAAAHSIAVIYIGQKDIDNIFRMYRVHTKYEIAYVLVLAFPELLPKLPPKRKIGTSEPQAMIVFDAVATGFAYLQPTAIEAPPPE